MSPKHAGLAADVGGGGIPLRTVRYSSEREIDRDGRSYGRTGASPDAFCGFDRAASALQPPRSSISNGEINGDPSTLIGINHGGVFLSQSQKIMLNSTPSHADEMCGVERWLNQLQSPFVRADRSRSGGEGCE